MSKLFMLLIGCTPPGRNTEQHDVFFGIGETIKEVVPGIIDFWPEAKGKLHVDAWREVTVVNNHVVAVTTAEKMDTSSRIKLFFINLGGYKKDEFEEFHYKMIVAAASKSEAIALSKKTAFYKHTGFKGADSHIDDKYGIDVDDIFEIADILPAALKQQYRIVVTQSDNTLPDDEIHLGYFKLNSFE